MDSVKRKRQDAWETDIVVKGTGDRGEQVGCLFIGEMCAPWKVSPDFVEQVVPHCFCATFDQTFGGCIGGCTA
jgi:hypothetical protein